MINTKFIVQKGSREKILIAAKKEFSRVGFSGARMDAIARSAELNKAMIHYYFSTKEKLYLAVLDDFAKYLQIQERIWSEMGAQELPVSLQLELLLYLVVKLHFHYFDEDYVRILHWEMLEKGDQIREYLYKELEKKFNIFAGVFEQAHKEKVCDCPEPMLESMHIISSLFFFITNRDWKKETPVGKDLYSKIGFEELYKFLRKNIFLTFFETPEASELPENLVSRMDDLLQQHFI